MESNKFEPGPFPDPLSVQQVPPRTHNMGWTQNGYPATNVHNVSQDSGLSPSPMEYVHPHSHHQYHGHLSNSHHQRLSLNYPQVKDETGIYDNYRINQNQLIPQNVSENTPMKH